MRRSFGTEISGNRGRNDELSPEACSSIISKQEAGVSIKELAAEFGVHWNTITKTIKRWKNHKTVYSLPREGRPEIITHRKK
jgi:transposase